MFFGSVAYTTQRVPSTELSCAAGHGTGPRGAHPRNTYTLTFISLTSYRSRPPPQCCLNQVLTCNYALEDFTQSSHSAEANHQARPALKQRSLRIRAGESLCFSDLAETNKKKIRNWFYSKAAGGAELDHKRPYESSHT